MKYIGILNSFALSLRADGTYEPFSAAAWKYVGEMILLGMGMVFVVLAILWAILAIFKLAFVGKDPKQPKAQQPKQTPAPKAQATPEASDEDVIAAVIAASIQAMQEDEMRDAQLVAILTAAVSAYRAAEGDDGTFRVVSFKRSTGGRAWNAKK